MSRRILVVEDDPALRTLTEAVLDDAGYEPLTASNGAEALEILREKQVQLILLDMRMPVMDGWAFAEAYHARPGPHAPVVVLTAAQDAQKRAKEIQAAGWIAKPFDLDHLVATVGRLAAPM
ncbi:MAG: response regulator [Dehalococcoidia bacterium]|nr:MAG: response regulator [Dehalococcoidia bacterium]